MAGTAFGLAERHDERDLGVPGEVGQEKAEGGGVALERVVGTVVQTIIHTDTHSHSLPCRRAREPRLRTPIHTYGIYIPRALYALVSTPITRSVRRVHTSDLSSPRS